MIGYKGKCIFRDQYFGQSAVIKTHFRISDDEFILVLLISVTTQYKPNKTVYKGQYFERRQNSELGKARFGTIDEAKIQMQFADVI